MEREISITPFDLLSNETHLNILDLVGILRDTRVLLRLQECS